MFNIKVVLNLYIVTQYLPDYYNNLEYQLMRVVCNSQTTNS